MKSLLFIGAHPDDETLATGLFLKAKQKGFETHILICSEGKNGKPNTAEVVSDQQHMITERNLEFETYCNAIGVMSARILRNPNTQLVENENLVLEILTTLRKLRPSVVVTHMNNDYHDEHQVVHNSVKKAFEIACRSSFSELGPKLTDSVLLEADGLELINNPDFYVDISDVLAEKTRIINLAYRERLGTLIDMDIHKAQLRGARKKLTAAECYSIIPVRSTSYTSHALTILSELIE